MPPLPRNLHLVTTPRSADNAILKKTRTQNGWFIRVNPIEMDDDWEVPLF